MILSFSAAQRHGSISRWNNVIVLSDENLRGDVDIMFTGHGNSIHAETHQPTILFASSANATKFYSEKGFTTSRNSSEIEAEAVDMYGQRGILLPGLIYSKVYIADANKNPYMPKFGGIIYGKLHNERWRACGVENPLLFKAFLKQTEEYKEALLKNTPKVGELLFNPQWQFTVKVKSIVNDQEFVGIHENGTTQTCYFYDNWRKL